MPHRHGYIRGSTCAQATDRQTDALAALCDELHIEHGSAVADERPVFEAVLDRLKPGDTFVVLVLVLDRAFRSSVDAMLTAEALRTQGVTFRILSLQVDTGSPEGELFYSLMATFAQFERRIIARRTKEKLAATRKRGVKLGRPAKLTDEQIEIAHNELRATDQSCRDVAEKLGVSRLTLQRGFR